MSCLSVWELEEDNSGIGTQVAYLPDVNFSSSLFWKFFSPNTEQKQYIGITFKYENDIYKYLSSLSQEPKMCFHKASYNNRWFILMNNTLKHFIKYLPIPLNLQIVFSNYWYFSFCVSQTPDWGHSSWQIHTLLLLSGKEFLRLMQNDFFSRGMLWDC